MAAVWSSDVDPDMLRKREFRATWVATAYNIDWPSSKGLSTSEQAEFLKIGRPAASLWDECDRGSVRAAGDLPSTLSRGQSFSRESKADPSPYYDPLAFMIEACHERNIEFHAWFNPFGEYHMSALAVWLGTTCSTSILNGPFSMEIPIHNPQYPNGEGSCRLYRV